MTAFSRLLPLIALWGPLSGHAGEWELRLGSERSSTHAYVYAAVPLQDGGFVLSLRGGSYWYDNSGTLQRIGPALEMADAALGQHGQGLIVRQLDASFEPGPRLPRCLFQQLDGGWSARALESFQRAGDYATDAAGRLFVAGMGGDELHWLDIDCHATQVPWPDRTIASVVTALDAPGAFVIDGEGWNGDRLSRVTHEGEVDWTHALPAVIEPPVLMRRLPDGDVVWTGAAGSVTYAQRVTPAGEVRWSRQMDASGNPVLLDMMPGGGIVLWTSSIDTGEAIVLDSEGDVLARHALGSWRPTAVPSVHALPARVLYDQGYPRKEGRRLVRVSADGSLQEIARLGEDERAVVESASGTVLAVHFVDYSNTASSARLIDVDGGVRPFGLPDRAMEVRTAGVASDDMAIAWAVQDSDGRTRVRLLGHDGSLLWERLVQTGGDATGDAFARSVHLLPSHVCAIADRLACWARGTGNPVLVSESFEDGMTWQPVLTMTGQDLTVSYARSVCSARLPCSTEIVRRRAPRLSSLGAPQAVLVRDTQVHVEKGLELDTGGGAWVMRSWDGLPDELHRIAADGELAWTYVASPKVIARAAGGPGGRLLVSLHDGYGNAQLVQLHDDGAEAWRVPVGFFPFAIEAVPEGWLLAGNDSDSSLLALVRTSDGSVAWIKERPLVEGLFAGYHGLAAAGVQRFVTESAGARGHTLEWRALADGTLLDLDQAAPLSELAFVGSEDDAVVFAGATRAGPSLEGVLRRIEANTATTAIDATLDGAWYAPRASGQGFLLRALPDTGQVYGGWFTFGTDAGEDRANLRWFTLHGGVDDDAGTASLTIYRNSGGRFASAPATGSERVGNARMVRGDCDTMRLEYDFDAGTNGGAAGAIALQRLSGGGCTPPTTPEALRALHGSYHVPGSSGQGVLLVPASAGEPRLDGAWFTYDPEGAADDADAQHWFTLHSTGVADAAGPITMEIRRSIGGRFDVLATDNSHVVGSATLQSGGCMEATLAYAFDDSTVAGAYAGLSGELHLQRVDPCPDTAGIGALQ